MFLGRIAVVILSCIFGSALAQEHPQPLPSFSEFNRLAEEREGSITHLQKEMTVADARHLLERAGIGAHPTEIRALLGKTRSEAISVMIEQLDVSEPLLAYPAAVADAYHYNWVASDFESEQRQAFRNARDKEMSQLRQWWVREMLSTDRPAGERLMLIWHNHFVTAYSSINEAVRAMYLQHDMLREVGFSNFRQILRSVVRDAAMLNYLDNDNNRKDSPNENLARELMELFVLGEGNYSEQDVHEVARALTGYEFSAIRDYAFQLNGYEHDNGVKTILGERGRFDADDVIDILLEQPAASEFLAQTFWQAYVSEFNTDSDEIAEIAVAVRESDYDIRTLVRATLASRGFWAIENRGTIVKSPVDLLIGGIRTSGHLPDWWSTLDNRMMVLGQHLFEAPNVAGWPGGGDWITPSRVRLRENMLIDLANMENAYVPGPSVASDMIAEGSGFVEIRYAAENFQGPPIFVIHGFSTKHDQRSQVWRSPRIVAKGGVDTERFGRVDSAAELTWTTETFQLPDDVGQIDQFVVHFVNDHCCGPGGSESGDRNFFVDWVRQQDRIFLASQASQRTCGGSSDEPGSMYCSGSLDLTTFQTTSGIATADADAFREDTLYVDRVTFRRGQQRNRNRSWNDFSLMLKDVRFNDIVVDAMEIQLSAVNDNGRRDHVLSLYENECHPTCLGGPFPPSAEYVRRLGAQRVEFSLRRSSNRNYNQLTDEQKAFVRALWLALPAMYQAMQSGNRWLTRGQQRMGDSWERDIVYLAETLPRSRYRGDYNFVVAPASNNTGMTMSMMMADSAAEDEVFLLGMFGQEPGSWQQQTQSMTQAEKVMSLVAQPDGIDTNIEASFEALSRLPIYQLK